MSVMRLFSLVFVLVASLVHSGEAQPFRESKKPSEASGVKEETGKEVTGVGAVSNDVPHDIEGEDEDPEEVGVVFEELDPTHKSTEDEDEDEKEKSGWHAKPWGAGR